MNRRWLWILLGMIAGLHPASAQIYTQLHSFAGGSKDGANPMGSLVLSNGVLYGMTSQGGVAGAGCVFKMNTNANGCTNLHSFSAYAGNGESPYAALVLSGSTLYGMTPAGSPIGLSLMFRENINGTGYTNLHSFAGYPSDGAAPPGSLTLDGSTLYGMTQYGGTTNDGVVFALSDSPPEPPTSLTIIYTNNQAIVSWPSSVSGWTLQTNHDLTTGSWNNYGGPVIGKTVTNSPTKGDLFFRLWSP